MRIAGIRGDPEVSQDYQGPTSTTCSWDEGDEGGRDNKRVNGNGRVQRRKHGMGVSGELR